MVCVIFASHARSLAISLTSAVEKNLTPFCGGFPSGLSRRDEMRIGTSCALQPSTQAACSTVSRAGACPTNLKNCCCSSFIRHCRSRPRQPQPLIISTESVHKVSTRSLSPVTGGRALRARTPGHRPRNPCVNFTHATVTFAFYQHHLLADCRHCFYPTVGDMPLLSRNSHHARRCRGGLIAHPFSHVSWSVTSLVNTVHRRYQTENRRRERHRVGKAKLI